jgi:bacteriorhodopsin
VYVTLLSAGFLATVFFAAFEAEHSFLAHAFFAVGFSAHLPCFFISLYPSQNEIEQLKAQFQIKRAYFT